MTNRCSVGSKLECHAGAEASRCTGDNGDLTLKTWHIFEWFFLEFSGCVEEFNSFYGIL